MFSVSYVFRPTLVTFSSRPKWTTDIEAMVLVYPYLHHTLHLPFQPQGSGYSLACFHVINPFLPRDCKAVHTPIEPCWDPCRGTLVAFKQIPSYQVKGQTHSAASFFWSPGFCLCPFEKVPSDHVVLFSHQNAFLRVPKPSKMSPPREGESKITCFSSPGKELNITNPAISSELELGSERLVVDKNGRNTTPRARKTEGCRSRPADPPGLPRRRWTVLNTVYCRDSLR